MTDTTCTRLLALCADRATLARLSTLARATHEAGLRSTSVQALKFFLDWVNREKKVHFDEPFLPACARYDAVIPGGEVDACFLGAVVEQLERTDGFSSIFGGCSAHLDWLCTQPSVPAEMERRRVLNAARAGRQVLIPARLLVSGPDHLKVMSVKFQQ